MKTEKACAGLKCCCSAAPQPQEISVDFVSSQAHDLDSLYGNHPELFQAVEGLNPLILLEITRHSLH